jgi:hypothetical protein
MKSSQLKPGYRPAPRRLLGALCLSTVLLTPGAARASAEPTAVQALGRTPLAFEANRGQTDAQVRFLSRGPGYTLFLTRDEAVLTLLEESAPVEKGQPIPARRTSVVRMRTLGSAPAALVEGLEPLPGKSHYLRLGEPERAVTDVPRYAKVAARGIYPGIDLVFHGSQGGLEYDFVVAPGADPSRIGIGFEGAESLALDATGNLRLRVRGGELVQPAPVIYQEMDGQRRPVEGGFVLDGNRVGFRLASWDATRPLVIDPQIVWASLLGGSGSDLGYAIAVTPNGQAYVTGYTTSTNFPTKPLSWIPSEPDLADTDAFVTKFNLDGTQIDWSTYLGGPGVQVGYGIALDYNRNAHVVGYTTESDPLGDVFLVKLNAAGSAPMYSKIFAGSGGDIGRAATVDASGYAYITGSTDSPSFPTTAGAAQTWHAGMTDAFVVKLNPSGTVLYSTLWGGSAIENGNAITVDASGRAYVAGDYNRADYSNRDAAVFRLNAAGSAFQYSRIFGGGSDDVALGVDTDEYDNAYIVGRTDSVDFPVTSGAHKTVFGGGSDAFVTKLNNSGSAYMYSTYAGGASYDSAWAVAVDDIENARVAGYSYVNGQYDAWAFRVNIYGSGLISSLKFGGTSTDFCTGIALDSARNAFVVGTTASGDFPVTAGAFQGTLRGIDAFVAKLAL